ncbi:MAG TPA: NAD(P)-binding domain-containing protein [Methyloceanibacter sp.]
MCRTLGAALRAKGHTVIYGVQEPSRSDERNAKSVREAVRSAEAVILATPWTAAESVVCEHASDLAGRIVIDATNSLNPAMTGLALGFLTSGAELLQSHAHKAKFFKAFNSTGFGVMARPAMFVAGPAGPDKKTVLRLVADVDFEAVDAGEPKAAQLLEPLAMLWMQLALGKGDFAFVMARRQPGKDRTTNARAVTAQEVE